MSFVGICVTAAMKSSIGVLSPRYTFVNEMPFGDALFVINIPAEEVQRGDALGEPFFDLFPFIFPCYRLKPSPLGGTASAGILWLC